MRVLFLTLPSIHLGFDDSFAAVRIGVIYHMSEIPGVLDFLEFSTALICFVNSGVYFAKFHGMQSTAMAIEWVAVSVLLCGPFDTNDKLCRGLDTSASS